MELKQFWIKRGDRLPPLDATLQHVDGSPINLTGKTVRFIMRQPRRPITISAAAEVVDAATGQVRYHWGPTDTETPGVFDGEFEITDEHGKKTTVPNHEHLEIVILTDLG